MKIEGIRVRDDQSGLFPDFDLFSAEVATDTNQILIFHEFGSLGLSSIFGLRESQEETTLDMEFFLGIGSGSASGQVFLISDLDLDGDPSDAFVVQGSEGLPITLTSLTATQSLLTLVREASPTALDVGPASEFAPLLSNQLVTLTARRASSVRTTSARPWRGRPRSRRIRLGRRLCADFSSCQSRVARSRSELP